MSKIENRPARIRGMHRYNYRRGQWAKLIGVEMATPDGASVSLPERAVFVLEFDDGEIDYLPISDLEHYEIEAFA